MDQSINGSIEFYGCPEVGFESYVRHHLHDWIRGHRSTPTVAASYNVRVSFLTYPGDLNACLVACEMEVIVGSQIFSSRGMAHEARRSIRLAIDHLTRVRQDRGSDLFLTDEIA